MKALTVAASAAAMACVLPAMAQAQVAPAGLYGSLGYAHTDTDIGDLGGIQGRVGWRMNDWLGVEGELATGIKGDEVDLGAGVTADVDLEHQAALYAVGFAPLSANTDLIARIGYGTSKIEASAAGTSVSEDGESWNFGLGAQHHFDGVNGVRVDWTRHEFTGDGAGKADVWSIAYTRRF